MNTAEEQEISSSFLLSQIVQVLSGLSTLKSVGTAAELSLIQEAPPVHQRPAAWIIPLREQAQSRLWTTSIEQIVTMRFGIMLGMDAINRSLAQANLEQLWILRGTIIKAVTAIQGQDNQEILYIRGKLQGLQAGIVWWLDEFETQHLIPLPLPS